MSEERRMTLAEVRDGLAEAYEDIWDEPLRIEDQFGRVAYVTLVDLPNGPALWSSLDFEDSDQPLSAAEHRVADLARRWGEEAMSDTEPCGTGCSTCTKASLARQILIALAENDEEE